MKATSSLLLLLAASSLSPAQEENPFLNQTGKQAPPAKAGESFLSLEEHILAPAGLVDGWLAAHPEEKDSTALRAAAQGWIAEGKATLDFTGLSTGIVGREFFTSSVLEQIFATELVPEEREGEWKHPTSFETSNLGYEITGDAVREKDQLAVRAAHELTKVLSQQPWDKLTEETRHPGDIFTPQFSRYRIRQQMPDGGKDARGRNRPAEKIREEVTYPAGKTHLALRENEILPQSGAKSQKEDPSGTEPATELDPDRMQRLVFFRNDPVESAAAASDPLPENYLLTMRLIEVDHRQLSNWLQKQDLGSAPKELNKTLEGWNQDGSVKILRTLSGAGWNGTTTMIEDSKEIVYPTEYEPGEHTASEDGKDSRLEFATATSFETRNAGALVTSLIEADAGGPLLRLEMERIIHSGFTVHHRVQRDGEWVADMTMPRFSTNRWRTTLRLKLGEWILVGSGAAFLQNGEIDHARSVLAFVKVE